MSTLGSDRWRVVSQHLEHALDLSEGDREAWLATLTDDDPDLVRDIRALLDEHRALAAERFLEGSAERIAAHAEHAGQTVGAYTLLSPIGEGGMSRVWLAARSDGRFERRVAVKFLSVALAGRGEERFRREGTVLARLTHPHIAQLVDAGVFGDGQPFLILEYVDGQPIDRYCDEHQLDLPERIRLFLDVLSAVAHAHANLIVHRDIKPSNVLVDRDGNVKLLDFGIAKLLEHETRSAGATLLTRDGGAAMTPEYAAPEQMTAAPITTATDVYALGVLLYVLLTGQHPIPTDRRSPAQLIKAVVDTEPPRMSAVAPQPAVRRALKGDLDTVVGKALKKDPAERYLSVTALADDLRRYLRDEPIGARPDTVAYRTAKFVRRNRMAVGLAAAALVAAIAGAIGIVAQARVARTQRDFAYRELSRAEALNDLNSFILSDAAPSGKTFTVNDLLARAEHIVEKMTGNDTIRVHLLAAIGGQYASQDQEATARRVLTRAYDLSRSLADASARARASCALADSLARSGEFRRAEGLFQTAMHELPDEPQFTLDRIYCLEHGSYIAQENGTALEGIARAEAAVRLAQQSSVASALLDLRTMTGLAESYRMAGRSREAVDRFERTAPLLTSLGRDDTQMAGTIFNNWALALDQVGRPLEAERIFRRAIDITRDDRGEQTVSPMLLLNYARALGELARSREAADYADRAYEKAVHGGDEVVINQSLLLRSEVYCDLGDLARASLLLGEVEPRLRRVLPPGHLAFAAISRQQARIAQARHEWRSALELQRQSVSMVEASIQAGGPGANNLPSALGRRANLELELGLVDEAATDARRALTTMDGVDTSAGPSFIRGRAYLTLGRALRAQGRRDEARAALASAVRHLEITLGPDHPDTQTARRLAAEISKP